MCTYVLPDGLLQTVYVKLDPFRNLHLATCFLADYCVQQLSDLLTHGVPWVIILCHQGETHLIYCSRYCPSPDRGLLTRVTLLERDCKGECRGESHHVDLNEQVRLSCYKCTHLKHVPDCLGDCTCIQTLLEEGSYMLQAIMHSYRALPTLTPGQSWESVKSVWPEEFGWPKTQVDVNDLGNGIELLLDHFGVGLGEADFGVGLGEAAMDEEAESTQALTPAPELELMWDTTRQE